MYAADFSNSGELVTLWAPGQSIRSACDVDGTCVLSGTSMAAPHVAGSLAVLRQLWPGARVDQLLAALVDRSLSGLDEYSRSIRVLWLRDVRSSRVVAPPPAIDGPRELAPGQPGAFRLSGTATMAGEPVDFRMEWGDGSVSGVVPSTPERNGRDLRLVLGPGDLPVEQRGPQPVRRHFDLAAVPPLALLVVDLDPDGPDLESRLARLRLKCNLKTCTLSGTVAVSNRGRARSASTYWDVRALRCPAGSCSSLLMRSGRLASLGSGKTRSYSFNYRMAAWEVADVVSIGARADTGNKLIEASEINNEVSAPLP